MRRKFQCRGSERTLCHLKDGELVPCSSSCFTPFLLQRLSLGSWCQGCCTNAEAKTWQCVPSDHRDCFGTECSESSRQGGETASGHCNFLSLSVVRRSFGVCRCFVYIRILRHAACWRIWYKAALEIDSCSLCLEMEEERTHRHETGHFPVCFEVCSQNTTSLPLSLTPWKMLTLSDVVFWLSLLMFNSRSMPFNLFCLDLKCISRVCCVLHDFYLLFCVALCSTAALSKGFKLKAGWGWIVK